VAVEDVGAVLLVGGSSRIPLVGQLVAGELGRPVAVDARPKDAICVGAALVAMSAAPAAGASPGDAVPAAPVRGSTSPAGPPPPPGSTPPGGWPAPPQGTTTGSATNRRLLFAAVAVVILLAGILGALLLTGDDSPASGDDQRTATTESVTTDGGDDSKSTSADDDALGGLDPGDAGGDSDVALDPLPGDDWSDEARAQFMVDCPPALGAEVESLGVDTESFGTGMEGVCGCLYDDMSATSDFAAFNEQWSGQVDPGSPVGQALTNAIFSCTLAASG
jgi:hypothetical protein